jgi:hypothetical protein
MHTINPTATTSPRPAQPSPPVHVVVVATPTLFGLLQNPISISHREIRFGMIKAPTVSTQFRAVQMQIYLTQNVSDLTIRDASPFCNSPSLVDVATTTTFRLR